MAGGEGTRLRPLTSSLPKPMVPILNKPVMEHIINLLCKFNITDIGVTTYYLPTIISNYFGDGEKFGVHLNYYIEETPLGTGGSVLNTNEFQNETFIVISGDCITNININDALEYHKFKKSKATLILKKEPVPLEYGIVIIDANGKIVRFLEKPNWGEVFSDTINTGIYILEPEIFNYYKKGENFDFSKDLFPKLLKDNIPMYGYVCNDYWCDIGDIESYRQTQFDILRNKIAINSELNQVKPGIWIHSDTFISEDVIINPPVYIGKGCEIRKGTLLDEFTILGDYCEVGENTTIKKSIIWDKVHIGKNVQCRGTTICSKVIIKNNVNLFENSIVGTECYVSSGVTVKPNIKIWPNKNIDEDSTVNKNLIWGSRSSKIPFGNNDICGEINIDITPEFACTLGSTFATIMRNSSSILVSSDGFNASNFIKSSIISGILSTGSDAINLENVITPISRYAVRFYNSFCGVHVRVDTIDENKIHIELFNNRGGNIDRKTEKSIEHLFLRGDFERCSANKIKSITHVENFANLYIASNINVLKNITEIKSCEMKIFLSSSSNKVCALASTYLQQIGCKIIIDSNIRNYDSMDEYLLYFSNIVKESYVNLGVCINDSGENIILFDKSGHIIKDDMLTVLTCLIALKDGNIKKLIIPLSATSVIEKMARNYNVEVVRAKSSTSDIMNEMLNNTNLENNDYIQYILNFDGILACGKIIDFLAKNAIGLDELLTMLPNFHVKRSELSCDFKYRGYIIRKLIEDNKEETLELFEGVKINSDDGWTLILPDNRRPVFNIYTEGFSEEYAEELIDIVNKKIQILLNED